MLALSSLVGGVGPQIEKPMQATAFSALSWQELSLGDCAKQCVLSLALNPWLPPQQPDFKEAA